MILRNIQISRGIAALIVLLAHANLLVDKTLFDGALIIGWCGVDFFFVLSGFIIYMTNRRHFANPAQFRPYLTRRVRRVYPIYWIYTLGVIVLAGFLFALTGANIISSADMSTIGLIRNLLLLPTNVPAGVMPILPVAWTLSYELLFYALFSVALLVKPRVSLGLAIVWVMAIIAGASGLFEELPHTSLLWVLIQTRNLEFLMGCLSAWAVCSNRIPISIGRPMLALGLTLLAASWVNAHFQFRWVPQLEVLVFGVPFFLIVTGAALLDLSGKVSQTVLSRVAVFFGDASYSVYLVHFTVIVIVSAVAARLHLSPVAAFCLAVVSAISAGIVAFIILERPLMRLLNKPSKSDAIKTGSMTISKSTLVIAIAAMFISSGITVALGARVPQRFIQSYEAEKLMKSRSWPYAESVEIGQALSAGRSKKLVMLGDSLTEWGRWDGTIAAYTLVNQGIGGNKTSDIAQRLDAVEALKPSKVMLMAGINDIFAGVPESETLTNYEAIVQRLNNSGIEVVMAAVLPISKLNSRYGETNEKVQSLNAKLHELAARNGVEYFDLAPELVAPGEFVLREEYTVDSVHLSRLAYAQWTLRLSALLTSRG